MEKEHELILSLDRIPTLDEFLDQMKAAPPGFASIVLGYLYDNFFKYSIDIKGEYNKYYSIEYSTFEDFVSKKMGLEIYVSDLERCHVLLVESLPSLLDPIYSDNFLEQVMHQLEVYREN